MHDNLSTQQVVHLGNLTLSGTTPAASAWVDLKGYDACTIMMVNNTITDAGTASGFTATVQDSDTTAAADAAAIAATSSVDGTTTTVTVTADDADNTLAGAVGYVGGARYVRTNVVGTTGTDADVSVFAILGKPSRAATTFVGTSVPAT
ncbi:MAG: hypothetical protein ABNH26_08745 [Celeribacter sp.]|jgi:hypothetical protein